ncbi:hypothetical protein PX52LOC_02620 [Limnoglobus roseus]|uniref:Lipoprotein n=1 Tax=Limnoglobus roseus TaxID=2598579 RepID=A0A5C1AAT7_9BACT|nr:hypothetical protein PX52LOC_02620 [Limnoglobus roseus]
MKRRLLRISLVVVLIVMSGCVYLNNVPWITVQEVRNQIERELPVGTPRWQVSDWLITKGYSKSGIGEGCCDKGDGSGQRHTLSLTEFSNYRIEFPFPTYLLIWIEFDAAGRRTDRIDVREFSPSF